MIERKIQICIGTDISRHVRARLSLLIIDGETVISEQYHSISIEPGADLARIRAVNEASLESGVPGGPWPKIPDEEWADLERHVAIVQKPEVVEAYIKAQAQARASAT